MEDLFKNLTKEDYRLLLESLGKLQDLVKNNKKLPDGGLGICYNWSKLFGDNRPYKIVMYIAKDWKYSQYKGYTDPFPIPENRDFGAWKGPNRYLRINLMSYIRKRLRDRYRRAK